MNEDALNPLNLESDLTNSAVNQDPILELNQEPKPNSKKINSKYVLIGAIVILIAGAAFYLISNSSILSSIGLGAKKCEYQGQIYKPGENVPSIDNCNSCSCDPSGQVACTSMACLDGGEYENLNKNEDMINWSSFSHQTGFSVSYPNQLAIKAIDITADYVQEPEIADHIYIYESSAPESFEQRYISIINRFREVDENSKTNPVIKGETEMFYLGTEESGKFDSYLVTIPIVEEYIKIMVSTDPQKKETANKILETFKFNSPVANPEVSLKGKLQRIQRPSPEINYDYELILSEPYFDELNAMGPRDIERIVVVPENDAIKADIEKYFKNPVEIEGSVEWGLAETRHLLAKKVSPIDSE